MPIEINQEDTNTIIRIDDILSSISSSLSLILAPWSDRYNRENSDRISELHGLMSQLVDLRQCLLEKYGLNVATVEEIGVDSSIEYWKRSISEIHLLVAKSRESA